MSIRSDDTYMKKRCPVSRETKRSGREQDRKLDLYRTILRLSKNVGEKSHVKGSRSGEDWGKQEWESALQFRRATSLIVFYNLMVHDSKSRIEAPIAAVALGKHDPWRTVYQKMGQGI